MREKDIPVEVVEIKPSEVVTSIYWEPAGERLGFLSTESSKITVYFYEMNNSSLEIGKKKSPETPGVGLGKGITLLKSFEKKGLNTIVWSPKGRFCVLGAIQAFEGTLEFWDVDELTLMGSGDHYMCSNVEFDPTGRYVVSHVSFWNVQSDTGYNVWSFTGGSLLKENVPCFKQFRWRPRPPSLLTPTSMKAIKKSLKEYSKEFEEVDAALSNRAGKEVSDRREKIWNEWKNWRRQTLERAASEKADRAIIRGWESEEEEAGEEQERGGRLSHTEKDGGETFEEWEEEVIEESEESCL